MISSIKIHKAIELIFEPIIFLIQMLPLSRNLSWSFQTHYASTQIFLYQFWELLSQEKTVNFIFQSQIFALQLSPFQLM